ncbi:hypothetical protein PISMIDRAFT_677458 [Pisolithus microcarpus 441]|uniref:Uncharacterized protein n=1 Tax=Pisolithus microcarpus 441 TaxID=765257 RepID=A0A0C9ZGS5_9AGAM|nr:hypothetical protein PISMIDRAFT_677458 [Pisolithus microcarpus 441]
MCKWQIGESTKHKCKTLCNDRCGRACTLYLCQIASHGSKTLPDAVSMVFLMW